MVDEVAYPPEPWQLGGTMAVSVWRRPVAALPASLEAALPTGARPLLIGGQALVGVAFVRYEPGGVLAYDELLLAVLVRHRGRPRVTIPDIWVDSPASRAGGRALWSIPKHLARFHRDTSAGGTVAVRAQVDAVTLADARVVPGRRLPGWRRVPLPTAQRLDGVEHVSRVQSLARVRLARAAWRFPVGSPLHHLDGHRPFVTAVLEDMAISFGGGDRVR